MRKLYSLLVLSLFAVFSSTVQATGADNCLFISVNNSAFFNFCPFAQAGSFVKNDPDSGLTVNFALGTAHQENCDDTDDIWATVDSASSAGNCDNLAVDSPSYAFNDINNETSGLTITFPTNANSQYNQNRNLIVLLYCNESVTNASDPSNFYSIYSDSTNITIQGSSYYACPYITISKLLNFLENNKYPFVAGAILLGLFVCFFGLRMFRYTIFIITAVAGTLGSGMLFFEFTKLGTQHWILWVIFGTCVIIGCVLGYLTIVYEKLGFFALGVGLGIIGGFFIYNTILTQFIQGHSFVIYLVVGACALVGGGLALWLWKDIIIIATSIIGSYMVIRAIAVLIGGFPNEISVASGVEKLGLYAYIYLGVILVIALVGMYWQFREKKRRQEEEEEGEDEEQFINDKDRR